MAKKGLGLLDDPDMHPEGFKRITLINEGKEPVIEIQYNLNVLFEILEIGNFETSPNFYIDIKYMNRSLENENNMKFQVCACTNTDQPVNKESMKWNLKVVDNINDILDLTSNPMILSLSKATTDSTATGNSKDNLPIESDQFESNLSTVGYMLIDLFDIVKFDAEPVVYVNYVKSVGPEKITDMKTWKNQPHIKYRLIPERPLLGHIDHNTVNSIKITVEFAFNIPLNLINYDSKNYYRCDMILSDVSGNQKIISSKNGEVIQFKDIHPYKIHYLLSDYSGDVKYTRDHVNLSKDFKKIIIPDNIKLRNDDDDDSSDIITDSTIIINFQNIYKRKLFMNDLKNFIKNKLIINLYIGDQKNSSNQYRYVGIFENLNEFNYVDRKKIRFLTPLIKYDSIIQSTSSDKGLLQQQTVNKKLASKSALINKSNQNKLNLSNNDYDSFEYLLNESNLNACLLIEIELDKPLIPRKKDEINLESLRSYKTPNIHDQDNYVSLKSLEVMFSNCVIKYIENISSKAVVSKGGKSDRSSSDHRHDRDNIDRNNDEESKLNEVKCEQEIYGSALRLLCARYDFLTALKNNSLHEILEDSYIYIVNKIHEIYAIDDRGKICESEYEFRLQCAMECTAFNMLDDAKEFYLMNIRDNESSAAIIDYAIHNIFIGDLLKAHECCTLALNNSSDEYTGFLLQSYIAYVNNNKQLAEEFLNHCIGLCKNFLEAWVALYYIYLEIEDKPKMEFIELKLTEITEDNSPLNVSHIHRRKEIVWQPMNTKDPYLKGIIKFIQLGCLNYACIGLSMIAIRYGCSSFEYAYHTALIDYYHRDYASALRSLSSIKYEDIHENYEKQKLQLICLLEMGSDAFFSYFNKILFSSYSKQKSKDIQRSLLYLKLGTFYMNQKKFKSAQYYFKKSVCHFGTYVGFLKLGEVLLKFKDWNNAQICYKMALEINDLNPYSWTYLTVAYFYKNMIPQSQFCASKARMNGRIDDKMEKELDKIDRIIKYQEQITCKKY